MLRASGSFEAQRKELQENNGTTHLPVNRRSIIIQWGWFIFYVTIIDRFKKACALLTVVRASCAFEKPQYACNWTLPTTPRACCSVFGARRVLSETQSSVAAVPEPRRPFAESLFASCWSWLPMDRWTRPMRIHHMQIFLYHVQLSVGSVKVRGYLYIAKETCTRYAGYINRTMNVPLLKSTLQKCTPSIWHLLCFHYVCEFWELIAVSGSVPKLHKSEYVHCIVCIHYVYIL